MIKRHLHIFLLFFFTLQSLSAQIPERPSPPRLVNDLAGILTDSQQKTLEKALVEFSDSTSNQIVLLTVKDLNGYDKAQFAFEVGQKWGVGQSQFNNGIVILIKPKTETNGEVFIAVGYGLEGVLPDATCKQIIEDEMIPWFKEGDYYKGIVAALNVVIPICKGEYSYQDYADKSNALEGFLVLAGIIFFIVLFLILGRRNKGDHYTGNGRGNIGPFIFFGGLGGLGSGRPSGGSFGGFGGGSFGGGGAGGSW